jgi:hypothetical protein
MPELEDVDLNKEVSVQSIEGKVRRPIVNYNQQQIERLTGADREEINRQLEKAPEIMAYFGYSYVRS